VRFSERHGHKTARQTIQIDSISQELRNSLWSLLKIHFWDNVYHSSAFGGAFLSRDPQINMFCRRLWFSFFRRPLDTLTDDWGRGVLPFLRKYFFACEWWEVYDFVEFVGNNCPSPSEKDKFIKACNMQLEAEMSAYRFVNGLISPIADDAEIAEVDVALAGPEGPVRTHLRRALELLSDRESPDYRNSIKESISAVESLVATVVGKKGTLGQLIKKLEDDIDLHPALRDAFSSLYGYTSDKDGIRHAILESKNVVLEDAKFFLVVCSAFVNFVESKVAKGKS
jgi:AbiJ N-terminal domain 4